MSKINYLSPVIPSEDIERDIKWYKQYMNCEIIHSDSGYAVLKKETFYFHLQWHSGKEDDPIIGSVLKFFVDDLDFYFNELLQTNVITKDRLRMNTPWGTNEIGFYDLNKNAIFFVESI